ncbi:uncharacterized protein VTP21DRAFT_641 [Calcarisporiella thermophila]|uniref:uncharacterized protein n=1 Tax=Calcarisporiella thermophila TaxID=911321 RepID=UPI0037432466
MYSKATLFCLLALLGIAFAQQQIFITNPTQGTVWEAGKKATIVWTGGSGQVPIKLMTGNPNALQQVAVIGTVEASTGTFTYDVPANLPAGNQYAIAIGNPPPAYSPQFTIQGGDPNKQAPASSASAPASAPASAAPSASSAPAPSAPASGSASASAPASSAAPSAPASSAVPAQPSSNAKPAASNAPAASTTPSTSAPAPKSGAGQIAPLALGVLAPLAAALVF